MNDKAREEYLRNVDALKEAGNIDALRCELETFEHSSRAHVLRALVGLGDFAGIASVWPRLDAGDRTAIIETLYDNPDSRFAGVLSLAASCIGDLDGYAQDRLARALGKLGGPVALEGLKALLLTEDPLVKGTVRAILFGMSEPGARQLLRQEFPRSR